MLKRILKALAGAILRIPTEIVLFGLLSLGFMLTVPYRIMRETYIVTRSISRTILATLFKSSYRILGALVITPLLMLGQLLLNPISNYIYGFNRGFGALFQTTWLRSRVLPIIKDYFDFTQLKITMQSHQRFFKLRDEGKFADQTQIALSYYAILTQKIEHTMTGIIKQLKNLLTDNHSFENKTASTRLANQINQLKKISDQAPLPYLDHNELKQLQEFKDDHSLQARLDEYNKIVTTPACIYTMKTINELSDPVTIEVTLNYQQSAPKIYCVERSALHCHFQSAAKDFEIPMISQLPIQTYDNLWLNGDATVLMGTNDFKPANKAQFPGQQIEIKIYCGIPPATYFKLEEHLAILKSLLPQNNSLHSAAIAYKRLDVNPTNMQKNTQNTVKKTNSTRVVSNESITNNTPCLPCIRKTR